MEDRFYLLNIKHSHPWAPDKSPAEYWLDDRGAAPTFYGDCTVDAVREGTLNGLRRGEQPALFVHLLAQATREGFRPVFITIDSGKIWIYSPLRGPFEDAPVKAPKGPSDDLPKYFEVEIITTASVADAPLVLSSMRVNRWLSSGTFVPLTGIQYRGNIEAARMLAGLTEQPISRLDCLSSVELETLVAKLFEEQGFFVPAYRGGSVDGFDLIVEPPTSPVPALFDLAEEGAALAIQVKLRLSDKSDAHAWLVKPRRRYLITAQNTVPKKLELVAERVLTRSWLTQALAISPLTRQWLERSTRWVRQPID